MHSRLRQTRNSHGFSLVELAIVLVILGLLIGGILAGRSLIRASELRAVSSDISRYTASLYAFRDKYFALPGDFTLAKSVWSSCLDQTNNPCNGDGSGRIDYDVNCSLTSTRNLETFRAWQHLAYAGLVEGSYDTALHRSCFGASATAVPGSNIPQLRIQNTGIMLLYSSTYQRHIYNIGAVYSNALHASFLTPADAWNLDTKLDDGIANSGRFRAESGYPTFGGCSSGANYTLTQSETRCKFSYLLD